MNRNAVNLAEKQWVLQAAFGVIGLLALILACVVLLFLMLWKASYMKSEVSTLTVLTEKYTQSVIRIEEEHLDDQLVFELKEKLFLIGKLVPARNGIQEVLANIERSHSEELELRSFLFDREKGSARIELVPADEASVFTWVESLTSSNEGNKEWSVTVESSEIDDHGLKVYFVNVQY